MAQLWFDTPYRTHMSPDDMLAEHMRLMMYASSQHPMPFYPMSPYGMGELGDGNCADPFIQVNGVAGTYGCACPKTLFTVNDPGAGRQCVPSCPQGTKPFSQVYGYPQDPNQSEACVADPNYVPSGSQINLQTGVVTRIGSPNTPTGPNLTPSAAPTQAPASQPGVIQATTGTTPASQTVPPATFAPGGSTDAGMSNVAPAGTIFGMSETTVGLIAAGVLGLFLLSKGGR